MVYAVFFPLVLLDLFVMAYQFVCFPLYGIPRVRRRDYLVFDRAHLAYLNALKKLNCAYCSYGNGLAAYVREVVARTEQYWCPIKHARRLLQAHPLYGGFVDYGDGEGYRRELQASARATRRACARAPRAKASPGLAVQANSLAPCSGLPIRASSASTRCSGSSAMAGVFSRSQALASTSTISTGESK